MNQNQNQVVSLDKKSKALFAISTVLVIAGIIFLVIYLMDRTVDHWVIWSGFGCVLAANILRMFRRKRDRQLLANQKKRK